MQSNTPSALRKFEKYFYFCLFINYYGKNDYINRKYDYINRKIIFCCNPIFIAMFWTTKIFNVFS